MPEHGALWLDNWILHATIASVTSQHENYPAKMLLTPLRSDSWWSVGAGTNLITFDLGEPKLPTCFALVASNVGGDAFRLRGADDSAMNTGQANWFLPPYPQDPTGEVMRWYLGDPSLTTSGAIGHPHRFWSVRIEPGFAGTMPSDGADHFELSVVWLGEHTPIVPGSGTRIRTRNPTVRVRGYGRALWTDPLTPNREAEVRVVSRDVGELEDLAARIDAQGTRHALLDLHAYSTDAVLARGGCVYGVFGEDPSARGIETYGNDDVLTFTFDETAV